MEGLLWLIGFGVLFYVMMRYGCGPTWSTVAMAAGMKAAAAHPMAAKTRSAACK